MIVQNELEYKQMTIFAKRLREERKARGLTQRQISELLGISQGTYKGYEKAGEKNGREPSIDMLVKISTLLDISLDYLLGKTDY